MDDLAEAQRLFDEYERGGDIGKLVESVDILKSLIEENRRLSHKSRVFKERIVNTLYRQVEEIGTKYNLGDFVRAGTTGQEFTEALNVMSKNDANLILAIIGILAEDY